MPASARNAPPGRIQPGHDRLASSLRGQPLITAAPGQFTYERLAITRYHDTYLDAHASEGHQPSDDESP